MSDPPPYPGTDDIGDQPDSSPNQPNYPSAPALPAYPTAQPAYPTAQPAYPSAQPAYPSAQPAYSSDQPDARPPYFPAQAAYSPAQSGYAPPQAGYPAPQQGHAQDQVVGQSQSTSVVITTVPTAPAPRLLLGKYPVRVTCPYCHADVLTRTDHVIGLVPWITCVVLIIFGCIFGCCLIPFCISPIKDVSHKCPNCQRYLGTWAMLRF